MKLRVANSPVKTIVSITALMLVALFVGWQSLKDTSHAADIKNFDPGNIMSDAVMSNKSTMTVQEIQNFLNSKNYCDNQNTYMADWYPHLQYNIKDGRFVCMAREDFGGKSAAQLIWEAGQEFSINPQVLIVLLEKEQGLVTDTWPNHVQYRTATGFGCPDTAPCDTQYYGMRNQLRLAAKLFREVLNGGWSNYPVGQRYVQYHPNAGCGGTVINIQNRATSALYRYTPYQPNQSALDAGYGTGDSCSAYGNRNFWRLFTDWFGTTKGYNWQSMDEPRWMEVSLDTKKIDLSSGSEIDDILPTGYHIKFTDKTIYNNQVYLRTEWDYDKNIAKGIPLSSLKDIGYERIEPEWRIVNFNGVHKYIARQNKWVGIGEPSASFPLGTIVKVVDRITVNGQVSYRTAFDSERGYDLAFAGNRVPLLESIPSLEPPRNMQMRSTTSSRRIDGELCSTIQKYETIRLEGKAIINGALYFSPIKSGSTSSDFCFINPSDTYWGAIEFSGFEQPREMKLKWDTKRIDAYTGETIDILKAGRVIHFSTKTVIGNDAYFRTTYNGDRNEPFVLPASALTEA